MLQTVLLVDPDAAVRSLRSRALRQAGFKTLEAAAGADAAQQALLSPPALIIVRAGLPDSDGFALCRRLKAEPALALVPVLLLLPPESRGQELAAVIESGAEFHLPDTVEPQVLAQAALALSRAGSTARRHEAELCRTIEALEQRVGQLQQEERDLEEQKQQSLGALAGGVAHDFNNLLATIIGNATLALEVLPPGDRAAELIDRIIGAGQRAAELTRRMLAYSGRCRFILAHVNLSTLLLEMRDALRATIPPGIELLVLPSLDLPDTEADATQLRQLITDLVLNAVEAIGQQGGRISLRTAAQFLNEDDTGRPPGIEALPPGHYVLLEVTDTGCGMDEALKARIFDPFFSTKFVGRGLGLAAVDGIVRAHHGAVLVDSAPGQGSRFSVLLPAA